MTGKNLICPKCKQIVARIIGDMYMICGTARFWEKTRFTCKCGKPMTFVPVNVERRGFDAETQDLLNRLGQYKKYQTQKGKGKK